MFQNLRAILLASGALVALGTVHDISAALASPKPAVERVMPAAAPERLQSAQIRSLTAASVRAVAIGF